jgi:PPK2 family polyphosphate:nucleotide phosphotransferase
MVKKTAKNSDELKLFRVEPGSQVDLSQHDPGWIGAEGMEELSKDVLKERAVEILEENRLRLAEAQNKLNAQDVYAVLIVLQAMDAAGKDGIIKHVMSAFNPLYCQVTSFKVPTPLELDHDFIWRNYKALPERGRIGIFNRSYYEEVLVVKIHPEFLEGQRLPPGKRGGKFWKKRYQSINNVERHLTINGTQVVKFFLHLSKEEQKDRFLKRLEEPEKNWKFSVKDLSERGYWDDYMAAYEEMLSATSTPWAPWYIIPADHKWVARTIVSSILTRTILDLGVDYPTLSEDQMKVMEAARLQLEQEV